jgi:sugar phosphate isomerase/epimerase
MISRRNMIRTLGLGAGVLMSPNLKADPTQNRGRFSYCLNTSTISGKKLGVRKYIEIAAKAGYDGIELWIGDIQQYLNEGNSLMDLKTHIRDSGVKVENAIGFAPWMVEDDAVRKAGFEQMGKEMGILAELDCTRVAAPAAGVKAPLDLFKAGERFKELLDLGRGIGVMPQLEFWGAFPFFHHLGQVLMVAAVANDHQVRILPDVYHLYRGDSGFDGLKMLDGNIIEVFHMNDFVTEIPREKQEDKDRVYPGDGAAPMKQILTDLRNMGGDKVLSLELFNRTLWEKDPLEVAKTGLEKMKSAVASID